MVVKLNNNKNIPIRNIGNFTKNAVENFEQNIVDQTDYLEKVDNNLKVNKNTGIQHMKQNKLF
ncbi:hypothetical protein QUW36_12165 [Clostridium cadaveris]|nr:hypothetical protein [Clostridium cadaveris]MDM8312813.1 hypothetical protein [Clostridium cadaveris]